MRFGDTHILNNKFLISMTAKNRKMYQFTFPSSFRIRTCQTVFSGWTLEGAVTADNSHCELFQPRSVKLTTIFLGTVKASKARPANCANEYSLKLSNIFKKM